MSKSINKDSKNTSESNITIKSSDTKNIEENNKNLLISSSNYIKEFYELSFFKIGEILDTTDRLSTTILYQTYGYGISIFRQYFKKR